MNFYKNHREIISYILFGIISALINWVSYTFFMQFTSLSVLLCNISACIIANIFAFMTNKIFVFRSKSYSAKTLAKEISTFASSRALTTFADIIFVPLLAKTNFDEFFFKILHLIGFKSQFFYTDGLYVKIIFGALIVALNYIFSKFLVFRNTHKEK